MDLQPVPLQAVEQAKRINGPARSGDSNYDSQKVSLFNFTVKIANLFRLWNNGSNFS